MVIGRFEPKEAEATSLAELLAIGLDEALTAVEEAIHDLADEQAWSRPSPDRHCIATLVMHMQHNIDLHACQLQTGALALEHDDRFDIWRYREPALAARQDDLPSVRHLLERLQTIRAAAMGGLRGATEDDLLGPRAADDREWWTKYRRTSASAYARVIYHTMAHVRQIWLLRGMMGLTDTDGWPQQHYH